MTRINCAIPVGELSDKHLLAEHREIKRVPNCIKSGRYNMIGIPDKFTLGKGHVRFFYNKLKYLHNRYLQIYNEAINRGFNVTNFNKAFECLPDHLYNDYQETDDDYQILIERLKSKDPIHYA